jgi:ElaB/YqjD/DUF883 family membrane-anchored ribosome-binding protein
MADPVYPNRQARISDPMHPTQPLITDPERELPENATPSSLGHIPTEPEHSNPRLNSAAESIGSALGTAVTGVRHLPNRVEDAKRRFTLIRGRKGQDVKEKMNNAVERAKESSEELLDKARVSGGELLDKARVTGEDLKQQAQVRLEQAQNRAQFYGREYPLQVIGTAAAFGMLMGIVLRIWRDHAS